MTAALGALAEALEVGAQYVAQFEEQGAVQKVRRDGQLGTAKLIDQSLILPEAEATKHITSILRKRGAPELEVNAAIRKWSEAQAGPTVDLGRNVLVRKWENHPSTPAYTEPAMSPLVPLKIAYEFAALILGVAILQPAPGLDRIREALREQNEAFAKSSIVERRAPKPAPFHGVAFMGNVPAAVIQVRLFGFLAYEVTLLATAINFGRLVYTHRLDTGDDWVLWPDEDTDSACL
jgi:hypothetical protein